MSPNSLLKKEAEAFDRQIEERIKHGFIPDLRRLRKVDWFYNNVWRDPEFVKLQLMPKINFVLNIAKKSGGRVVEFGCGSGYLTLELARYGLDVIGIDISPKTIEIANKFAEENLFTENFGSLRYYCADFFSVELKSNSFDTVIFFGTLHHIKKLEKIMLKVSKILKEKGNLIVCEPIRANFTKKSAEFAAILRTLLPTWEPYSKKLQNLKDSRSWENFVEQIFNEYTYKNKYKQSILDNITASEKIMTDNIRKFFKIQIIKYSDAFFDKLIGGLRGKDKYKLASFLKFLDNDLIKREKLPPTYIKIHAIKL